jgi:hypothetical protein
VTLARLKGLLTRTTLHFERVGSLVIKEGSACAQHAMACIEVSKKLAQ